MATIVFESAEGPIPFEAPDDWRISTPGVGAASSRRTAHGDVLAPQALEDALQVVGRTVSSLRRALNGLEFSKAEATIAVKLSAEGNFVVAKTTAEATLSITVSLDSSATS